MENIYQAPQTNLETQVPIAQWHKNRFELSKGQALPKICLHCGSEEHLVEKKKQFHYVNPLHILWVILSPLILFIVYLIVRKQVKATHYYCSSCDSRTRKFGYLALGLFLLSVAIWIVGAYLQIGLLPIIAVLVFIVSFFPLAFRVNKVRITGYRKKVFYFKGIGKAAAVKLNQSFPPAN